MHSFRRGLVLVLPVLTLALPGADALAQKEARVPERDEPETGSSNSTDLSLVVTSGNANTETFGFGNTYTYRWPKSRFRLKADGVRSNTADDTFAVATGGGDFRVVRPPKEPDVERYFAEARYDREITRTFFWNAGLSWDRNLDAGIINRWILFAGVGNIFWDRDDLKFNIAYGLAGTDREEETPDPEKDERFVGPRFTWDYMNQWGKLTQYDNDWTVTGNFKDIKDFTTTMTNAVTVTMSKKLALKVSLQWIYNNEPALEDVDLFLNEGMAIKLGEVDIRREKLDTTFSTSLVVSL